MINSNLRDEIHKLQTETEVMINAIRRHGLVESLLNAVKGNPRHQSLVNRLMTVQPSSSSSSSANHQSGPNGFGEEVTQRFANVASSSSGNRQSVSNGFEGDHLDRGVDARAVRGVGICETRRPIGAAANSSLGGFAFSKNNFTSSIQNSASEIPAPGAQWNRSASNLASANLQFRHVEGRDPHSRVNDGNRSPAGNPSISDQSANSTPR